MDRITRRAFGRQAASSSALKRQSIQSRRIALENLQLRRIAEVFSLFQFAHNEGLAVAVRHVRAENHVVLADEIDDVWQQDIIGLGAEKEVAFPYVVHWRQIVPRSGLRMERG